MALHYSLPFVLYTQSFVTCIHSYSILQNNSTVLNICAPSIHPFLRPPELLKITEVYTVSIVLPFS